MGGPARVAMRPIVYPFLFPLKAYGVFYVFLTPKEFDIVYRSLSSTPVELLCFHLAQGAFRQGGAPVLRYCVSRFDMFLNGNFESGRTLLAYQSLRFPV